MGQPVTPMHAMASGAALARRFVTWAVAGVSLGVVLQAALLGTI
jgi:hypothetical protein